MYKIILTNKVNGRSKRRKENSDSWLISNMILKLRSDINLDKNYSPTSKIRTVPLHYRNTTLISEEL
jgi:hypothetical protein